MPFKFIPVHLKLILLTAFAHLLTRVSVEKLKFVKLSCFQSFTKWYNMLLHFHDYNTYCIAVSFDFLVSLNEATSVDILPFTYMKYPNKVSGPVLFSTSSHCNSQFCLSEIALRTVSKNRLHHQRPPT